MNFQEFIAAKTAELEQIDRAYRRTRNDIEVAKKIESKVAMAKQSIKDLLKSTEELPKAVRVAVNEALLEELTIITPIEVKARVRENSAVLTPILNEVYDIEPYAFVETRTETIEHSSVEPETVATESSNTSDLIVEVETVADVAAETEEKKPRRKTARGFQRKCGEWQELLPKIETEQELDRIKEEIKEWGNYEPPAELIDALDAAENRISTTTTFKPSDLVDESGVYLGDIPDEDETVTEPTPQSEFLTFKAALENASTLEEHQEVCNQIREADTKSAIITWELVRAIKNTREKFEVREEAEERQNEVVTTKVVDAPPTPTPTPVEEEKPKSPFAGRSVRKKETVVADVGTEAPVANEGISLGGIDTNTVIKIKNLSGVPVEVTRHSEDYIVPVGTKLYDSVIDCAYSVCDWDEAELMNSAINKDTNKIPVVSLFDDRVYLVLGDLNKIVLVSDEEAQQLVEAYKKKVEAISSGDVFA